MYTDKQEALRNSLWNFMGSILSASTLEDSNAKQNVTALMSEELCKFVKNEDETSIDMVAAKPMFKSIIWILDARIQELNKLLETAPEAAQSAIKFNIHKSSYIKYEINNLIDKI